MENKAKNTVNKLLECCSAIIHLSSAFRNTDRGAALHTGYHERILTAFDYLERAAFEQQIPTQQIQNAKYALAAFVDELVLSSAWPGRNTWMGKPLQLQFFGEHLAGEGFFKKLIEIRQTAIENIDVLEIYYICLQLGFEGAYRMRGLDQLLTLQIDIRNQIELIRGVIDPRLAPDGVAKPTTTARVGMLVPYWVIASVTAAILFFIYLVYAIAIDHQAGLALKQINHQRDVLFHELKNEITN